LAEIKEDSKKVKNIKTARLQKKYNREKEENSDQLIEGLKQKVSAKTQRLSRYRKRQNQYYQHKLFRTDCKKFYNSLRQTYPSVKNAPDKEQVENFWKEIYGKKVQHNREVYCIKKPVTTKPRHGMEPSMWKAPGREQIPNFWLKQLTATHKHIAAIFNKLIEADQIPEWLTAGVTFLIQKKKKREY
jgi:hypothetical protein